MLKRENQPQEKLEKEPKASKPMKEPKPEKPAKQPKQPKDKKSSEERKIDSIRKSREQLDKLAAEPVGNQRFRCHRDGVCLYNGKNCICESAFTDEREADNFKMASFDITRNQLIIATMVIIAAIIFFVMIDYMAITIVGSLILVAAYGYMVFQFIQGNKLKFTFRAIGLSHGQKCSKCVHYLDCFKTNKKNGVTACTYCVNNKDRLKARKKFR